MTAVARTILACGITLALLAPAGGDAQARTSARCSTMPGSVIASSETLDLSRVQNQAAAQVFRVCYPNGNGYSFQVLFRTAPHAPTAVQVAGDYVALRSGRRGAYNLFLFDPAHNFSKLHVSSVGRNCAQIVDLIPACEGIPRPIGSFWLDELGRLAWVEPYTSHGRTWVRLRVRTQAGATRTVARRRGPRSITGVKIVGYAVRWLAGGRVHKTPVEAPGCQLSAPKDKVIVSNATLIVASQTRASEADRPVFRGCLRSDGRWRDLIVEDSISSHGFVVSSLMTAGTWVALNTTVYPDDTADIYLFDLASGHGDRWFESTGHVKVLAVAADGRLVYATGITDDSYDPRRDPTSTLYAAGPGRPRVTLDEGPGNAFTDVSITGDIASWKNAGVAKSAALP